MSRRKPKPKRIAATRRVPDQPGSLRVSNRLIVLFLATLGTVVTFIFISHSGWPQRTANTNAAIRAAQQAMRLNDYESALETCDKLLKAGEQLPSIFLIAGESASKLGRFNEAVKYYERVPDSAGTDASIARWAAGEITLHLGRMSATIDLMEQSLRLDQENTPARERLVYLLNLAGRRWDAAEHLFHLVRHGKWSVQHLIYIGNLAKSIENERELRQFHEVDRQDPLPLLGLARLRMRAGLFDEAKQFLDTVLRQAPTLIEANVQMGKLLLQTEFHAIQQWHAKLPSSAETHPEIWMIRGEWLRKNRVQLPLAARCYIEAVRRDPNHLAALHGLAQVAAEIGYAAHTKDILARTERLDKLLYALERIMSNEWSLRGGIGQGSVTLAPSEQKLSSAQLLEPIILAAQLTHELGRVWESLAWCQYGIELDETNPQLRQLSLQTSKLHDPGAPQTQSQLALNYIELSEVLQLPTWNSDSFAKIEGHQIRSPSTREVGPTQQQPSTVENTAAYAPRFEEQETAIQFTYFASRTSFADGRRMFEMTGGGVGILDIERDGRPDLFLAQGCSFPTIQLDEEHGDALFRNVSFIGSQRIRFDEVTRAARIRESAYGQGISVGDVDADGFDDIYVCNVGRNQLWLNQGDGTFRDGQWLIDGHATTGGSGAWTVSAAVVDLNLDGQMEIYDANYVEGEDVFSRRCWIGGLPRACSPMNFRPAAGVLWGLDKSGTFRDITPSSMAAGVRQGNALGVSVMRTQGSKYPSIFVANDQIANLMLTASPQELAPLGIVFEDRATLNGLAFDGDGKAQACMGIATGDVDRNGLIDLLVTNYYDEPNTLYLQQSPNVFRDATKAWGLVAPSLKMLGFGSQFLDADCDGWLDLVVLNGHIDDMSHMRVPFRMRAQFFGAKPTGKFVEQPAGEVGDYFASERLGRALAIGDFDVDGREDFVATDLERNVSLVRNVSRAGNYIRLSLVGIQSARDAIGAEVVLKIGGQSWTSQLSAGGGYMASNERTLHFGLGQVAKIDLLEIEWPSGIRQVHENILVNAHYLAVENEPSLLELKVPSEPRGQ